ncbi:E3 ubiquitin-protein ligase UHRF1-like [Leguminivora glycinivorella]|uniref:E3 ubiquitin-protein ligase UHRF1-like n=1 Tax=Leguminivora glycinivorella TaxID=1035111 RepID=UPI00200FEB09|nr:E3 ubiquitin-protein ligase UHRF1-like [Leguminivora glycinivorella]
MHVRVRIFGKPDTVVAVNSKLTKIEQFRHIINETFNIDPKSQRLLYGGKLLDDGYTFHDYNIKLNDVIQLMVCSQPEAAAEVKQEAETKTEPKDEIKTKEINYIDAESIIYQIGDLIDMKDREQGAWFEGKVVRIVQDPDAPAPAPANGNTTITNTAEEESDLENNPPSDSENTPPSDAANNNLAKPKKKGIADYFTKTPKKKASEKVAKPKSPRDQPTGGHLLYKVQLDDDDSDTFHYCKLKEIRPRARTPIEIKDLKVGQTVMINHNTESPLEKGYWYDFKVEEIKKLRLTHELIGTLYLGPEAVPQNDTRARVHDKIFAIEDMVPLAERTEEYKEMMITQPEKRSMPLNCLTCRDNENARCKDCGCFLCAGKEFPDKIVLCDECNKGFHMICLDPPLTELPEDDWYCPGCKRDSNAVVAPGAGKQRKKAPAATTTRDWGRGMACVGKTKTCSMPANHFGPIPGIEVGMCWRFRIQLSESGVHRPPVSGIHGRDEEGAYSIVLSGGYEDDVDHGYEFTYTGSGGRDLSGNKRTAGQSCDQTLTRENKALARNCAAGRVSEEGGDAGEAWRAGKPVRVVRSYKMLKHFPKYAPKEGIRYDGIYKVVKYYPERGLAGFRVWKYLLRRDDPEPAPWEPHAKKFPAIYPEGYLEAEALKLALKAKNAKKNGRGQKGKKRAARDMSDSSEEDEAPPKRRKNNTPAQKKKSPPQKKKSPAQKKKSPVQKNNILKFTSPTKKAAVVSEANPPVKVERGLSDEERQAIAADELNAKLWSECLMVVETRGKKEFVEYVSQMFLCIICQEVAAGPVTTKCLHNFCGACLKLAFKSTGARTCPCCRAELAAAPPHNERLAAALRAVMPGYDASRH